MGKQHSKEHKALDKFFIPERGRALHEVGKNND